VPLSKEDLKNAFARWATGVTIVTARVGDRIHGMTVSAFNEVSLDPPLVLVCIDKSSSTQALIAEGKVFAVNILERGQADLSSRFASKETEGRRFVGLDYQTGVTGAPLLVGTVANLDCRLTTIHDAGDHFIFVGEVVDLQLFDGEPLMFHDRGYRGLAS
jgi:3-hydroxy-9,10-secoandrosta-1,3,5(10)-triene-9,17-dione monooxygenase reductase component